MAALIDPASASFDQVDPGWAWAVFEPSADRPWDLARAAHLYRRGGFGATWAELESAQAEGVTATVDRLLTGGPGGDAFYQQAVASLETLIGSGNAANLPAWWLHVMLHTPHPLQEKLTLFWHGHFATSAAKVDEPDLMWRQNDLLRRHSLGKFRPLLEGMAKDPAMLLWLDSATNKKSHPNENFAREVMELFSLGLGHYTEDDIKQAARAFTGWEVRHSRFVFNKYQHDVGDKTVLGQTGAFNGDDVLRILLEQPAASRFLVHKLFRYLVNETMAPPAALVDPLAEELAARDYDIGWVVGTILRSNLFYSEHALRQRIKPPVDFAIGLLRSLEGTANTYALAEDLDALGQAVFFPPNVKGWDGGTDWINSSTLVARANLVWGLVGDQQGRFNTKIDLEDLSALDGLDQPAAQARRLVELLLAAPLPDEVQIQLATVASDTGAGGQGDRLARVVHAIATLPEFQLS